MSIERKQNVKGETFSLVRRLATEERLCVSQRVSLLTTLSSLQYEMNLTERPIRLKLDQWTRFIESS